jgi:hypothetical protein
MKNGVGSKIVTLMFICLCVINSNVLGKDNDEELNTGQDFTRPLTRMDIRQKYQALPDSKSSFITTFRADKPVILSGDGWILSLRADLPFVVNNVPSADNPNSTYHFGLSDFLNQFIFIAPQGKRNWTYGFGSQIIWPTASEDQMGTGRYQVAPLVGLKVDMKSISPGSFSYLLLRNHIDVGGKSSRSKTNYLVIQPGLNIGFPDKWFATIAPEMRVDWENDGRYFFPFDITVGKMLNKSTILSIEYKTPIIDEGYPMYNHEVEARVGFFF